MTYERQRDALQALRQLCAQRKLRPAALAMAAALFPETAAAEVASGPPPARGSPSASLPAGGEEAGSSSWAAAMAAAATATGADPTQRLAIAAGLASDFPVVCIQARPPTILPGHNAAR